MNDQPTELISDVLPIRERWTEAYKQECFMVWYRSSKPSATKLADLIHPEKVSKRKPLGSTLNKWVSDFNKQAASLDEQVERAINERLVAEKVEMLNRHAETAKKMQEWSIDWLENNIDKLNSNAAIRLWVEAIRIERESKNVPTAWSDTGRLSDEDLQKKLIAIVRGTPPEVSPNDDLDDVSDGVIIDG